MNAEIVTVKLKIKDKTVELSATEAKELLASLEALFQRQTVYIPYQTWPQYVPTDQRPYEITCGSAGNQAAQIQGLPVPILQ